MRHFFLFFEKVQKILRHYLQLGICLTMVSVHSRMLNDPRHSHIAGCIASPKPEHLISETFGAGSWPARDKIKTVSKEEVSHGQESRNTVGAET